MRLTAHVDAVLPGRVHRAIYERMVDDTEAEVRALLEHLGLVFEPACLKFRKTERAVRTDNLADQLSVNGRSWTIWLTKQERINKDYALFGEASFDVTPQITLTAGGRLYKFDNSLFGFAGYGRNPAGSPFNAVGSSRTGVAECFAVDEADPLRRHRGLPARKHRRHSVYQCRRVRGRQGQAQKGSRTTASPTASTRNISPMKI